MNKHDFTSRVKLPKLFPGRSTEWWAQFEKAIYKQTATHVWWDVDSPAWKELFAKTSRSGPGTELARLIHGKVGLFIRQCGGCTELADEMDRNGPDWCLANIDLIEAKMIDNIKKKPRLAQAVVKMAGIANENWTPRAMIQEAVKRSQQTPPSSPPQAGPRDKSYGTSPLA